MRALWLNALWAIASCLSRADSSSSPGHIDEFQKYIDDFQKPYTGQEVERFENFKVSGTCPSGGRLTLSAD